VLMSGERMSSPETTSPEPFLRLRAAVAGQVGGIRVLGYVRAPRAFLASDFQQRLRMGAPADLGDLRLSLPRYRDRFEKLDRAFGAEAVDLRVFARARLAQGDVVADLAARMGVPPPPVADRYNQGLSLEATALLYAIRRT